MLIATATRHLPYPSVSAPFQLHRLLYPCDRVGWDGVSESATHSGRCHVTGAAPASCSGPGRNRNGMARHGSLYKKGVGAGRDERNVAESGQRHRSLCPRHARRLGQVPGRGRDEATVSVPCVRAALVLFAKLLFSGTKLRVHRRCYVISILNLTVTSCLDGRYIVVEGLA